MLIDLLQIYDIDKNNAYMIGDKLADVLAGQHAGLKSILVKTGHGATHSLPPTNAPNYYIAPNMAAAANHILDGDFHE